MTEKFEWFMGRYHSLTQWGVSFGYHYNPKVTDVGWAWFGVTAGPDYSRYLTWSLEVEVYGRAITFWIDRNMDFTIGVDLLRYK